MYLRPKSSYSLTQDHTVAVIYTVLIPMLNPLIYSLRNKDVKEALRKVWGWNESIDSRVLRKSREFYPVWCCPEDVPTHTL